jgi:hypothetical protein
MRGSAPDKLVEVNPELFPLRCITQLLPRAVRLVRTRVRTEVLALEIRD